MNEKEFIAHAIRSVVDYHNTTFAMYDTFGKLAPDQVYVVWLVKVLQNNKALLSTTIPDRMYYEVTWNGDKQEAYLDAYSKDHNTVLRWL